SRRRHTRLVSDGVQTCALPIFFEPLEHAHDHGAMRPRARERHVEMVASARGGKAAFTGRAGTAIFRHPVAKARGRAHETPLWRARAVLLVLPDAVDQKTHAERPC